MRRAFVAVSVAISFGALCAVNGCTAILGSFEVDNALSNDASTDALVAPDGAFSDGGEAGSCSDSDSVRLASDGENCGRCGRSCGGGTCAMGKCAPVKLIESGTAVGPIAVSATDILFATADPKIQSCAKAGCGPTEPKQIAAPGTAVSALAIVANKTLVYGALGSANRPALFSCPTSGCTGAMNPFAMETLPSAAKATPLSVRGDKVVFSSATAGLSWSVCDGGSCGTPTKTGQNGATAFALAPNDVLFFFDNAKLASCPLAANCSRTDTGVMSVLPSSMAAAGSLLLWLTPGTAMGTNDGKLNGCALPGCTNQGTVASGLDAPTSLAADAKGAYWTVSGTKIQYCTTDCQGGAQDVATNLATPSSLVLDDTYLYWAQPDGVYRLAR